MNLVLLDSQDPNASASDAKAFDTRCILRRSHHAPNAPIWFQWRRTLHQCTRDYKHTYHKTGVTHHCKELWQDLHLLSKTFVITHQLVACRNWSISTCRHLPCQSAIDCHENTVQHPFSTQTSIGVSAQAAPNNHSLGGKGRRRTGTSWMVSWSMSSEATCD